MEIEINDDNLKLDEIDEFNEKVRAVLIDDNEQILVARYGDVILLPGGSIDEDESINDSILRELAEETGNNYDLTELDYFINLKYFQKNYIKRNNTICNRMIQTHYFIGRYKGLSMNKQRLTAKEKKDGFKLELIPINELEQTILANKNNNPRNKFFQKELLTVIRYYISKKQQPKQLKNKKTNLY